MFLLAKYNTQTTFTFPIVKRGSVDFAVTGDWTPAAGDTKISQTGGNVANTSNNPAAVGGTGSALWSLTLTAAELSTAVAIVQIIDAATKTIEDQCLIIYTYGNASAKIPIDLSDTVRLGLTALPNAAAEAAGGLYTRGTGAGQINQPANGRVDTNVVAVGGTTQTARDLGGQLDVAVSTRLAPTSAGRTLDVSATGEAGVDWANVGAPTTSLNLSGTTISTSQTITSVSGAVGSVSAAVTITAASVQAIWDALTSALTTVGSIGKLLVDNINATISSRLATSGYTAPLDAAGTRTAVGLASANLDTQLGDLPTAIENADALLARDLGSGTGAGTLDERPVRSALRFVRNKWSISTNTLTVTKEDDATTAWTSTLTSAAADPVTGSDPA